MGDNIEFRRFTKLPDGFSDDNSIEYLGSTPLINAKTGEETCIQAHHFKRTYPNDNHSKAYWDRKLVEMINANCMGCAPTQKLTLGQRVKNWFLNKFADLYEKVRGDYLDE